MMSNGSSSPAWLICPVCLEEPNSTPVQCRNGHILCQDCSESIYWCPVCRIQMSPWDPIRCLIATQAMEEASHKNQVTSCCCRAATYCNWMGSPERLDEHEHQCLPAAQMRLSELVEQQRNLEMALNDISEKNRILEFNQESFIGREMLARQKHGNMEEKVNALSSSIEELRNRLGAAEADQQQHGHPSLALAKRLEYLLGHLDWRHVLVCVLAYACLDSGR